MTTTRRLSMTTRYIGIDPGKKGAVAIIDNDGVEIYDFDGELDTYHQLMLGIGSSDRYTSTAVEDVCGRPGQSCQANTTFMKHAGIAEFLGFYWEFFGSFIKVKPQVWKKHFGLITKGLTKTQRKHLSIELAKKLYPSVADQLTASKDGRAEALLIARYIKDVQENARVNEESKPDCRETVED